METAIIIGAAFALGGILKGATGVGAPLLAVPLLTLMFDLPFAITIFTIPNVLPNIWQSWAYRKHHLPLGFVVSFALAGGVGAGVGTFLLTRMSPDTLKLALAMIILAYVGFRLYNPAWKLGLRVATWLSFPLGVVAGALQGAAGLSSPVSITFLTSMHLERGQFISTISVFFVSLGLVQIPMLMNYGYLNQTNILLSCAALFPLVAGMPLGVLLANHISRERFNQILLVILTILSAKLLLESFG